ncbi:hypothetical protein VTK73DRAFT_3027 [Phialemonium thermophilum]|uniref:Uncharacterized protein n=1 Tax=Phialemonium thermophilum TaxID=223376 RepID=A0ABR3X1L8_9PEZI
MAREGTRSQTGHSKPRVFSVIDTAPTIKRSKPKKKATKKESPLAKITNGKLGKPTGVTKKKATKKDVSTTQKVKDAVKKTVKKVEKDIKSVDKPKTTTAKKSSTSK